MSYTRAFLTQNQYKQVVLLAARTNVEEAPHVAAAKELGYPTEVFHNVVDMVGTIADPDRTGGIPWEDQLVYAVEIMVMTGWRI